MLGEVADLDVVAGAELARLELPPAGQRLDQRRLAGAVGADERDVLTALQPQLGVTEQPLAAGRQVGVLELEDDPPAALRRLEGELERGPVLGIGRDPLDLVELLDPRLGLSRPGAGPEARDEALQPLDLGLLALDGAAQGELARRLLPAPLMPGPGEELPAASLQLQHRRAHRLQEPAVVGDEDDGGVEADQVGLEPLERRDVQVVGRLVEEQQVRVPARARPSEARVSSPPEKVSRGRSRSVSSRKPSPWSVASARSRQP